MKLLYRLFAASPFQSVVVCGDYSIVGKCEGKIPVLSHVIVILNIYYIVVNMALFTVPYRSMAMMTTVQAVIVSNIYLSGSK